MPLVGVVAGFTLIELVTVLVVVSVLAVVAMPRFTALSAFQTRGFTDDLIGTLRFARATAVSQRRWVRVSDASGGIALSACAGSGDGCTPDTSACTLPVKDPSTMQSYSATPAGGVSLSHGASYSSVFYFDCEGRPRASDGSVASSAIVYTVSGDPTRTVTVEIETGYVH